MLGLALFALPTVSNAATNEFAQSGRLGLGFGSGRVTNGVSAKYFLSESMALQGVVGSYGGWGAWGWGGLGLSADLLFEMPSLVGNKDINVNWNVGAGASAGIGNNYQTVGVSGVAGISLQIKP